MSQDDNHNNAAAAALTRWLFDDFKYAYDVKFGRKGSSDSSVMGNAASNDRPREESNGNGVVPVVVRRERELAPYEKYQSQGRAAAGAVREAGENGNGQVVVPVVEKKGWQKPLPEFPTLEMMALADSIMQDIVKGDLDVPWDSIKGLENAKRLLKEAVVMPIKYPQYFTGLLTPWKGILLFGPPGTGKVVITAIF